MTIPRVDVRREFSICVSKMGGTVSDEVLMGRPNNPKNADFVFHQDNVIAELKCLEKDWADELAACAPARTEDWVRRGKLQLKSSTVNLADLPLPLVREIVDPFRKRLKLHQVAVANKQIKQTRLDLKQPTAKGLLILVNDGNHALAPEMMAHLMMPILNSSSYSAIHTVLYMSVNESVTVDHPFGDARFWMPWSIKDKPSVSLEFLTKLQDAWMSHLSLITGEPVAVLGGDQSLATMQFVTGKAPA